MAVNANYQKPQFKDPLRSKPIRTSLEEIQADVNDLQHQIDLIATAASGAEVVNARDYFPTLRDRNRGASGYNRILTGADVTELDTPAMQIKVSAYEAIIDGVAVRSGYGDFSKLENSGLVGVYAPQHQLSPGDSIYVEVCTDTVVVPLGDYAVNIEDSDNFTFSVASMDASSGTLEYARYSGTITAPSTNPRFDIVAINSDNSLSIVAGTENANPILPTITNTQKPIKILTMVTSQTTIETADIRDCRCQGVTYCKEGVPKWTWKIQDAIDDLPEGGNIYVGKGYYYEGLIVPDDEQVLYFEAFTKMYDSTSTLYELKDIDLSANTNTKIVYDIGVNSSPGDKHIGNYTITGNLTTTAGIKTDGTFLKTKVVQIGDWNMNSTGGGNASISVNHGLSVGQYLKIKRIDVMIFNDAGTLIYDLRRTDSSGNIAGSVVSSGSSAITLLAIASRDFDSSEFNLTSYNRGYVTIEYEP